MVGATQAVGQVAAMIFSREISRRGWSSHPSRRHRRRHGGLSGRAESSPTFAQSAARRNGRYEAIVPAPPRVDVPFNAYGIPTGRCLALC